jgi:hypothetical protein
VKWRTAGVSQMPTGEYGLVLGHEDLYTSTPASPRKIRVLIALEPDEGAEVRRTLTQLQGMILPFALTALLSPSKLITIR